MKRRLDQERHKIDLDAAPDVPQSTKSPAIKPYGFNFLSIVQVQLKASKTTAPIFAFKSKPHQFSELHDITFRCQPRLSNLKLCQGTEEQNTIYT